MMREQKKTEYQEALICDKITMITMLGMFGLSAAALMRYLMLGEIPASATVFVIHLMICLISYAGWSGRIPALFLLAAAGCLTFDFFTTASTVEVFYYGHRIQGIAALVGAAAGIAAQIRHRCPVRKLPYIPLAGCIGILGCVLFFWGGNAFADKSAKVYADDQVWGVPVCFDGQECENPGTVEEISYTTKAYATDGRTVEKRALVYLPCGYSTENRYNILYLLHGTGDDERAWLEKYDSNRRMLDHLIAEGLIEPLIVVTPTWYVEDDCAEDLDRLTYSFAEELRNDLIAAVESSYSTYAQDCSREALIASRDHRAFAGLSRGAVTMYHSGMCASLDYFGWFGAFSGSRTSAQYFADTMQSEAFADYPIRYLYVTSGNFDFAMAGQTEDYHGLLEVEPRLNEGVNTEFDIFPMRYHSWGAWHLALYHFLLKIF